MLVEDIVGGAPAVPKLLQTGMSASITATSAFCWARRSAEPPVYHPPCEKPRIIVAMAPTIAPVMPGFVHVGICIGRTPCSGSGDAVAPFQQDALSKAGKIRQ